MLSNSLDSEKGVDSLKELGGKSESSDHIDVSIQDVTPELSRLDRFARTVTKWLTQQGLEGHGYVTSSSYELHGNLCLTMEI